MVFQFTLKKDYNFKVKNMKPSKSNKSKESQTRYDELNKKREKNKTLQ